MCPQNIRGQFLIEFDNPWSFAFHIIMIRKKSTRGSAPYIIAAYFEQIIELAIKESSENIFLDKYFRKPMTVLIQSQIIDFKCSARRLSFSYLKLK